MCVQLEIIITSRDVIVNARDVFIYKVKPFDLICHVLCRSLIRGYNKSQKEKGVTNTWLVMEIAHLKASIAQDL